MQKSRDKRKISRRLLYAIIILIVGQTIYHNIMLKVESIRIEPLGKMVVVNGHNMHVYSEGKRGKPTLVFLSGSGTAAPIYDFKAIYSKFSIDYRTAVVERSGYGYSETSGLSRDLDKVLEETRKALSLAGEEPPYILVPHSMSGIESLYWAQKYPDEVKGIIGLDMSVPEAADNIRVLPIANSVMKVARLIGLQRVPFIYPVEYIGLTPLEMDQARYLTNRNAFNIDMRNETSAMLKNFDGIKYNMIKEVPILNFVSSDKESREEIRGFSELVKCRLIYLEAGHYVHQFEADTIYKEGKIFIESLAQRQ